LKIESDVKLFSIFNFFFWNSFTNFAA